MTEIVYGSVSKYGFGCRGYLFDLYSFPTGDDMIHTWLENEILLILHYIIPWKSIYVFHPIRTSLGRHFKARVPQGAPLAKVNSSSHVSGSSSIPAPGVTPLDVPVLWLRTFRYFSLCKHARFNVSVDAGAQRRRG
jgi:hypothetical protein